MATFSYSDLATNFGTDTADGLRNVANTAANFACDAWENYTEATSGFSDPTGIGKFNNALMSTLCTPRGKKPPSPPQSLFVGGQCPALYNVTVTYKYKTGPPTPSTVTFNNVLGPIGGIATKAGSGTSTKYGVSCAPDINYPDGLLLCVQGESINIDPFEILSIVPVKVAGPDNCGDPPPSYPPKTPPKNVTNNNTTVNVGGGAAIAVPIALVPVIFKPELELNPQLQVDVGPFNVTFDAGGVSVNPSVSLTSDKTLPSPSQNPSNPTTPKTQKEGTSNCDLKPVLTRLDLLNGKIDAQAEKLEDIEECSCPVAYEATYQNVGTGNAGEVALPVNTTKVSLTITATPANPKIQDAGDGNPPYFFCGYYSFGDGIYQGSRQAISVEKSTFPVPPGFTSFRWSLYPGYNCTVSITTLVPEKPDSELAILQMKRKPT